MSAKKVLPLDFLFAVGVLLAIASIVIIVVIHTALGAENYRNLSIISYVILSLSFLSIVFICYLRLTRQNQKITQSDSTASTHSRTSAAVA